ncbi:hypothetical protein [Flavobacterium subsaxonicum]|uniref:hypothetical protein n=1 Tax=Flavobacterium subsaxonicum TaxID=426226 RepID=UPI00047B8857|nr:hypothetical protein [Flavobacterium subsaxonicum]
MVYKLDFYTSHNQFYIADKDTDGDTGADNFWSDEAFVDRFATGNGIIGLRTQCYGPVKGELIVLEKANSEFDLSEFDHIVEGGLEVNSGVLQISDCPNSSLELEIKVDAGIYKVRIYSSNLRSVEDDEGDDYYKIEIWPDADMAINVLKNYEE